MRSPRTTTKSSPRSPQLEKTHAQKGRSNAAKKKKKKFTYKLVAGRAQDQLVQLLEYFTFNFLDLVLFPPVHLRHLGPASDLTFFTVFLLKLWEPWEQACCLIQVEVPASSTVPSIQQVLMKCLLNKLSKHVQTPVTMCIILSGEKFFLIPSLTPFHFSNYFPAQVFSW